MCQQFCYGGILLIIVFTIACGLALYLNVTSKFKEYSDTSEPSNNHNHNNINGNSAPAHLRSDLNYNSFNRSETCELLFNDSNGSVINQTVGDENFPLVVQLNYRTKGNNIETLCHGVAIHHNYILTLAQCLIDTSDRELISVNIHGMIKNATDIKYKISEIIIYDESLQHHSLGIDVGLIKIENTIELTNQFCVRRLENTRVEILSNVWRRRGDIFKLVTCNLGNRRPNRICVESVRGGGGAQLGDPLIENHNGRWYLIGLYQAGKWFPLEISMYTDIYFYRYWISNIIQSST